MQHREAIMVCAADLSVAPDHEDVFRLHDYVVLGPETKRVSVKAYTVAEERPNALIYATAGWSEKFRVVMNEVMADYLVELGINPYRLQTPVATAFNTNGEMAALVKDLFPILSTEGTVTIHLVCRWWHLPRASLLLRARLRQADRDQHVFIRHRPVWTFSDPKGMLVEPGGWFKNWKNMFG
ncbi:MAG: ElyC/SanA/YdcF family protein [Patescibacteria group bacterium]